MARSITAEAAKMKASKTKATKDAKRRAALEEMGLMVDRKKIRKPRKPMSDEQRQAASERLAKARAAKGPAKNTMHPEEIRKIPDNETFSIHNVKQWLVNQKELLSSMREYKDSKEPAERARYSATEAYVSNLDNYLRTGVYSDLFYGMNGTNKVKYVCASMAYYTNGTPKRSVGVVYQDIGLYTEEMEKDDRVRVSQQSKVLKDGGRYSPEKKTKLH
jgi:hypothetical protein